MDKKMKHTLIITVVGVTLFALLLNYSVLLKFFGSALSLITPVIAGGIAALFINVPVNGVEKLIRKLFKKFKCQPSDAFYHISSFFITLILMALVIFIVCFMIIPELVASIKDVYYIAMQRVPEFIEYLKSHNINYAWLEDFVSGIDFEKAMSGITDSFSKVIGGVAGAISSTVGAVTTIGFSVIIAIYTILGKNQLSRHTKVLINTYVKEPWSNKIIHFGKKFSEIFSKFITGQMTEAVILGLLMSLAFSIFKLPYAMLVGILTTVCAIIPYIGAFISATISVLLILLVEPTLALKALAVYLVVQFVENQFIYPRVVGAKVGLSPLYTLIAALIGGRLFGIVGILFFIPLTAVIYEIVRDDVIKRKRMVQ